MNIGGFCLILLLSQLLAKGPNRVRVLGWVCVAFSVSVFAAPLSIMVSKLVFFSFFLLPFHLRNFSVLTHSPCMILYYYEESGHTHQERRIHAVFLVTFSHNQCCYVALIWHSFEGFVCCGKSSISEIINRKRIFLDFCL